MAGEIQPTMPEGTITCPQCGHTFEMSDALTHQIREHLKTELQADIMRRETEAMRKRILASPAPDAHSARSRERNRAPSMLTAAK